MSVTVSQRAVTWMARTLFGGAILLLGYCGFVALDAWNFQKHEAREFDRQLAAVKPATVRQVSLPIGDGGSVGRIEIGRLGVSVIVMEGTSNATLRRAVGHISSTALPGIPGNVGLSAHRDTFFRPLRNIRQNDVIKLTTTGGKFDYRVVSTQIVDPTAISVLDAGEGESLTLVTCYPFYFVGPAPMRFIVRAERIP